MKKLRQGMGVLLCVLLAFACTAGAFAADVVPLPGEPAQEPSTEPAPTEEPPVEPTPEPATPEPRTPEPTSVVPLPGTPQPTVAPTAAPTPEDAGSVNVTMYVYTESNNPAEGYTVYIDQTYLTTDAQGMVRFPGVNVGRHSVHIDSPSGGESVGQLYMSRGATTVLTDQAMGGTYGMNIAEGQNDIYMVVRFVADEALEIETLSNTQPVLPEVQPSQSVSESDIRYKAKTVTATFLDEEERPISGMGVSVVTGETIVGETETDSRGEVTVRNVPYGTYTINTQDTPSFQSTQFSLTLEPALTTGISRNIGGDFVVASAVNSDKLFLQFRMVNGEFYLTDAQDSAIGGLNPVLLWIIIIVIVVVIIIIAVVVSKSRRRKAVNMRGPIRTTAYAKNTGYTQSRPVQTPVHPYEEDEDSLNDTSGERKTGGANKFDDRSRM